MARKAEQALAEGKTDMVGLARQILADPYWPVKAKLILLRPCPLNLDRTFGHLRQHGRLKFDGADGLAAEAATDPAAVNLDFGLKEF